MDENTKLNKKLVIEKPVAIKKKNGSSIFPLIIFIFILCAGIVFVILEKLNYIDYLNFL